MSCKGKVVVITGASDGIGAGAAILFAQEGASVAIVGRSEEKLKNVAAKCQKYSQALPIKADMTNEDDVKSIVKKTIEKFGKIDVLVNNAGMGKYVSILDENVLEVYDEIMNLNMRSVVQLTNLAAPYLIASKGNIINISSVAGKTRTPGFTVYCVSKAALDHFTRCVASELASKGVRVNSVNPGPVRTNFASSLGQEPSEVEAFWDKLKAMTAMNRVSDVDEIADMILYLAGDRARERAGPLSGRLSKSASELSNGTGTPPPPRARSAHHHHAPLSVLSRGHQILSSLKNRWHRSRSRERCPAGNTFTLPPGHDSSTDYCDGSSEHSTPANSPRHRGKREAMTRQLSTDPTPSTSGTPAHYPRVPADLLLEPDEGQQQREHQLRQYSFFQLRVHLKRGQNLVAMDKNGLLTGTSDPYVKFKLGGRLLHKSRTVYKDLNPVWDECFTVPIEDPFLPVQIKVFDYDFGLQDDFMGSCQLDLTALELGRPQDLVLCLRDSSKQHQEMGEVVMSVTLWPKSQEDKDQYLLKNTRLSDVNKRLKAQIWSSIVTIVLVEAKNLPAMDLETRSSDPYCKFRLGNEKYKSKVVWKSLHPSWLEQFDLHLYDDQEQVLEVTVWDKDKQTKDDFLGRCQIDLSKLEREKTHNIWQDLEDGNGQIFLLLTISGTTQSETITDLTSYRENPRDREIVERRYAWYRLNENSSGVGWLCVKVYGAKGLAAADLGGKSDPFCVLELCNSRLQTHTEYKTLTPNWMKIFTFTVKDITSILDITVYDEDHDHKVEFLGKLAIPLLNIRNGEKRWYALKDKKMRARAKGNYPQICLEMTVIWNPLKAAIRAINPKEEKFMYQEAKFKRQLFIRNVMRLKAIIMWFIEIGKVLQDCFEWESKLLSLMGLLAWLAFCYYYQQWMLPFLLLVWFARNWLIYRLTGGNPLLHPVDDEDLLAEEDDEEEGDKEEKKSLKERLQAIQEVTQTVQNAIGYVANLGEAVKNLMNFTVPCLSYLAIIMLLAAMIVVYVIPLRWLLMGWGVNKFTRKILRPHTIPNNEVLDILSRVPDDETLLDCREMKTHAPSDHRKDGRKKHKAS